jgi:aminodeoxyfutalosine synthase
VTVPRRLQSAATGPFRLTDPRLLPIADKVVADQRLDRDDALAAATTDDLLGLGRLANYRRERLHGQQTFFNVNRHLNPTNVCSASCPLCAFSAPARDPAAGWTWTVQEAVARAARDIDATVSELHIVGGLNPDLTVEYYEALFGALRERFPAVHIKALTMVELDFLAARSGLGVAQLLDRLVAAGLGSCPGGGAEIFAPEVRRRICGHTTDGSRWLEVARAVHRRGLVSNCTMLYGHIEAPRHRVDHLLALRALQDETAGFQCFVPLAFHPANTAFEHLPPTDARLDLQTIATARLVLDNVAHLKAYWVMLGERTAQVALAFGADDLDGTVVDERITRAAGGTAGRGMSRHRLEHLIREAGRVPVLRDTLYKPIAGPP